MKILIADDDPVSRRLLEDSLADLDHDVTVVCDGREAWSHLMEQRYDVVVSDWMMPEIDGVELCRRLRARTGDPFCYVMLITSRDTTDDVVEGITAGANDFMTKPWKREEFRARLCAAERVVQLERTLASRVAELQKALEEVATLKEILPICMYCKNIRDDEQAWQKIDDYIQKEGLASFTHAICPDCYEGQVQPMLKEMHDRNRKAS